MRKILILGGSGDIGQAIASQFSSDEVIAVGSKDVNLAESRSVKKFISNNKNFDVIINSVGYNVIESFENLSQQDIQKSVQINLLGFLPIVHANVPYWRETRSGRLVLISSLYGFLGRSGRMPYIISKHGLIGVMKTLAIELANLGVMTNAVTPGYIDTKLTRCNNTPSTVEKLTRAIPVGRLGTPEEIAHAVNFLASINNTYINGHDLVVDGGFSAGGFQNL